VNRSRSRGAEADLLVSTSTEFDSETAFLQVVGWDGPSGVFRYYERRLGTWILAGTSFDALAEPSRGRGPFDSHVNSTLVMKELKLPWSHWHSQNAAIRPDVLAPDDPFRNDPIWNSRKGGESFEVEVVRPGGLPLDNVAHGPGHRSLRYGGPAARADAPGPRHHRGEPGERGGRKPPGRTHAAARASLTFFLDLDAFLGPLQLPFEPPVLRVSGPAYAAARTALELRCGDGAGFTQPGETFFAFLVPERALEDQVVVETLIQREVLSSRLVTCLLMVDFSNPVYSQRRASLLAYVP
jgi:hypothetical protein